VAEFVDDQREPAAEPADDRGAEAEQRVRRGAEEDEDRSERRQR
jgi:hypothetical protein